MREIVGLRKVKVLRERPECIPQGKARGVKGEGVRYERGLAEGVLRGALHGVWFEYEDAGGHGFAQADFVWEREGEVIVGEAKLTWKLGAYAQLRRLYFPLVAAVWGVAPGGIVVCKNVTRETPKATVRGTLREALDSATRERIIPVLHLPLSGVAA